VAKALAKGYLNQIKGQTTEERMHSLSQLLADRRVPFAVENAGEDEGPVLTAQACPYPKLAEKDRTICRVEEMLFSELLGQSVQLRTCRLDGDGKCQFQPK